MLPTLPRGVMLLTEIGFPLLVSLGWPTLRVLRPVEGPVATGLGLIGVVGFSCPLPESGTAAAART
jgi:hypothetical protein